MQHLGEFGINLSDFENSLANAQCTEPNMKRLPDVQCLCNLALAKIV